jgi:hypothetical protein
VSEAARPETHFAPSELAAGLSELAAMYERGVVVPVCAWCGNHRIAEQWISPVEASLAMPGGTTHGICPDCYETVAPPPSWVAQQAIPRVSLSESQDA